jgi:hypothetical protein
MSGELEKREREAQRFVRFQPLAPGQYWRAKDAFEKLRIDAGMVLMISDIRFVEDRMHAVVVRPHPDRFVDPRITPGNFEFLVEDFLSAFDFEPDGEAIRQREISDRQRLVQQAQENLTNLNQKPEAMAEAVKETFGNEEFTGYLLEAANVSSVLGEQTKIEALVPEDNSTGMIDRLKRNVDFQMKVAERKAAILKAAMEQIQERMGAIMPFFVEQGELALARTKDVREYAEDLGRGLATLELFLGKGLAVRTVKTGEDAPETEPLTLFQRKLYVDEELSVFETVSESFDYAFKKDFEKALCAYPELVNQICPSSRGVVLLGMLREGKDYEDKYLNAKLNEENLRTFLMVRNGENIHFVDSSIESHDWAGTLFPSNEEMEEIFRENFFERRQLTLKDVSYSKKYATWEKRALHYRRFLILLSGLDRRLKLFGSFFDERDQDLFVSEWFQKKYMRFIHDQDGQGMMPAESRPSFRDWLEQQNAYLRSGSRVMVDFWACLTSKNSPGALWDTDYRNCTTSARYTPEARTGLCLVYRRENALYIDVPVSGRTNQWKDRTFDCRVDLSCGEHEVGSVICLDRVRVDDLLYYIQNRGERQWYRNYMPSFRAAVRFLREEEQREQEIREQLVRAVIEGAVADKKTAVDAVGEAVALWRAGKRGADLPSYTESKETGDWKRLLDLVWVVLRQKTYPVERIFSEAETLGLIPLRLVAGKKGDLGIYVAPKAGTGDRGLFKNTWCCKLPISILKDGSIRIGKTGKGTVEDGGRWTRLTEVVAEEVILGDREEAKLWFQPALGPGSFREIQECYKVCDSFVEDLSKWFVSNDTSAFEDLFDDAIAYRRKVNLFGQGVQNGYFFFPFGLVFKPKENRVYFLTVTIETPHFLYFVAPGAESRQRVQDWYVNAYLHREFALERVSGWITGSDLYRIVAIQALPLQIPPFFFHESWVENYWVERLDEKKNEGLRKLVESKSDSNWDKKVVWIHPSLVSPSGDILLDELMASLIEQRKRLNEQKQ